MPISSIMAVTRRRVGCRNRVLVADKAGAFGWMPQGYRRGGKMSRTGRWLWEDFRGSAAGVRCPHVDGWEVKGLARIG